MAKKLMINCASCDARNALEENYAHYEKITINCAVVLTSPKAKAVMNKLPFALNCATVLEVDGDVDLRTVNGSSEIKSSDVVPDLNTTCWSMGPLPSAPTPMSSLLNAWE